MNVVGRADTYARCPKAGHGYLIYRVTKRQVHKALYGERGQAQHRGVPELLVYCGLCRPDLDTHTSGEAVRNY